MARIRHDAATHLYCVIRSIYSKRDNYFIRGLSNAKTGSLPGGGVSGHAGPRRCRWNGPARSHSSTTANKERKRPRKSPAGRSLKNPLSRRRPTAAEDAAASLRPQTAIRQSLTPAHSGHNRDRNPRLLRRRAKMRRPKLPPKKRRPPAPPLKLPRMRRARPRKRLRTSPRPKQKPNQAQGDRHSDGAAPRGQCRGRRRVRQAR